MNNCMRWAGRLLISLLLFITTASAGEFCKKGKYLFAAKYCGSEPLNWCRSKRKGLLYEKCSSKTTPTAQAKVATPTFRPKNITRSSQPTKRTTPTARPKNIVKSKTSNRPLKGFGKFCNYGGNSIMKKNCLAILRKVKKGQLPKGPILYALKTLYTNSQKMCQGLKVKNSCQTFVTDLDKRVKGFSNRSPAYFINLCVGDKSKTPFKDIVTKTYTNRGTGSRKGSYRDLLGIKTTLPGVFVSSNLSAFHPYRRSRKQYTRLVGYRKNHPRCKGQGSHRNNYLRGCPVIRLTLRRVGGSLSGVTKPMHTSGFKSSIGCPSIRRSDNWIMRSMAALGPSFYISYTKQKRYKRKFKIKCKGTRRNKYHGSKVQTLTSN